MQNQNGVAMNLTAMGTGVKFAPGPKGMEVKHFLTAGRIEAQAPAAPLEARALLLKMPTVLGTRFVHAQPRRIRR
jgi:hypothetical protein